VHLWLDELCVMVVDLVVFIPTQYYWDILPFVAITTQCTKPTLSELAELHGSDLFELYMVYLCVFSV